MFYPAALKEATRGFPAFLSLFDAKRLSEDDGEDDEEAVKEPRDSISEMLLAAARHHAGSTATSSRELRAELGAKRMERIEALLVQVARDYPDLDAAARYVIVESKNPQLFEGASIKGSD